MQLHFCFVLFRSNIHPGHPFTVGTPCPLKRKLDTFEHEIEELKEKRQRLGRKKEELEELFRCVGIRHRYRLDLSHCYTHLFA